MSHHAGFIKRERSTEETGKNERGGKETIYTGSPSQGPNPQP